MAKDQIYSTCVHRRPRVALISAQTALMLIAVAGFIVLRMIRNQDLFASVAAAEQNASKVMATAGTVASSVAAVCIFAAAPGAHVFNTMLLPKYKLFQPFSGGAMFVALQGTGWTLYAIAALEAIRAWIIASWPDVGVLGLVGTLLLIASSGSFHPDYIAKPFARWHTSSFCAALALVCCCALTSDIWSSTAFSLTKPTTANSTTAWDQQATLQQHEVSMDTLRRLAEAEAAGLQEHYAELSAQVHGRCEAPSELPAAKQLLQDLEDGRCLNMIDEIEQPGSCDYLVAAGLECETVFAPGKAREGECDVTCGYCAQLLHLHLILEFVLLKPKPPHHFRDNFSAGRYGGVRLCYRRWRNSWLRLSTAVVRQSRGTCSTAGRFDRSNFITTAPTRRDTKADV